MKRQLDKHVLVTRSIITKYKKTIWNAFIGAIKDYELIKSGDRIAVCISGGKDSMLMAVCFEHLKKHSEVPFEVEYIVMDPGYLPENRELILKNAETLNIPVTVFDSDIFDVVDNVGGSPCYLCL